MASADPISAPDGSAPDVSVVVPTLDEAGNIGELVRRCLKVLSALGVTHEIIVVDGGSADSTVAEAREAGADVIEYNRPGYGGALRQGFARSRGGHIITMDSDLSHEPEVIGRLWSARAEADVIIASRYVPGGRADMTFYRHLLSRILNQVFTRVLRVPVRDISSGFRLYRGEHVRALSFQAEDFDVLEEILIRLINDGRTVRETPFHYRPRHMGRSHAKLIRFGIAYCRTLHKMWRLRRGA